MEIGNPFTPDFGRQPPVLAGRAEIIDKIKTVLAAGPSRREFITLQLVPEESARPRCLPLLPTMPNKPGGTRSE